MISTLFFSQNELLSNLSISIHLVSSFFDLHLIVFIEMILYYDWSNNMKNRVLFPILIALLLAACGQPVNESKQAESVPESALQSDAEPEADNKKKSEKKPAKEKAEEKSKEEPKPTDLSELHVHYINVGQADSTLFQYTDHDDTYTILYDAGDWNKSDVSNYLAQQNIQFIDLIIISHPHADHIGQLKDIIHTYDVGEVWLSGNTSSSGTFQDAIKAVTDSDADYSEPRAGDEFEIGPLEIEILHPSSLTGNLNEDSISARFTYGDIAFVFTGDAYKNEELLMMSRDVEADFLQLGHHGSNTSSDPAFIQAVDPAVAIYSASHNNSYGHPSPDVVSLIQNSGITLYGTDIHGTVLVTTDGVDYDVQTEADGTITPESTPSTPVEKEEPTEEKQEEPATTTHEDCVDINEASLDEVQAIIHIGPARAKDLIDQRSYETIDEMTKIPGIGPARIDDIKNEGMACVQ